MSPAGYRGEKRDFVGVGDVCRGFTHFLVDRSQNPGAAAKCDGNAGIQRDTHFIFDTGRPEGIGFLPLQTKELTDDPTPVIIFKAIKKTTIK